jgi:hypothetical protein
MQRDRSRRHPGDDKTSDRQAKLEIAGHLQTEPLAPLALAYFDREPTSPTEKAETTLPTHLGFRERSSLTTAC